MKCLVVVLAIAACGDSTSGNNLPGAPCSFDLNTVTMCQSEPGTNCHLCVFTHTDGGSVGMCARPCKLAAPDCPAGQTCQTLTGYASVGCGPGGTTSTYGACM